MTEDAHAVVEATRRLVRQRLCYLERALAALDAGEASHG